ncbi:MAG TPA: phosphocholine cytidylyltransferase family protein [Polyangia bacterium]
MPKSLAKKVIIVAAGRGSRLGPKTEEIPKCMVAVAGKPILHHQLDALTGAGVSDIVVVRGYRGNLIDGGAHRLRFVENPEWERNNIYASLIYAAAEMDGGFFFSYSDIVFSRDVARRLAEAAAAAPDTSALIVDRRWADAYEGRTLHPIAEAELSAVEGRGDAARVTAVGKLVVPKEQAAGEFIGLAYFSPSAARGLREVWADALASGGLETPFGRARALRHAYLSDGLNALAQKGERLAPVYIDGQWREIDTGQDLAAAEPIVKSF